MVSQLRFDKQLVLHRLADQHKKRTRAEDEALRQVIEMLFFAYRDFTSGPDEILREFGFGRAHHRAIYFIGRYPNQTVSNLLGILRITKQSLSRVLGQLVREGFVSQNTGKRDRRHRNHARDRLGKPAGRRPKQGGKTLHRERRRCAGN